MVYPEKNRESESRRVQRIGKCAWNSNEVKIVWWYIRVTQEDKVGVFEKLWGHVNENTYTRVRVSPSYLVMSE